MINIYSQSAELPLPLADVKAHLRVDSTADDGYITNLIWRAVETIESETAHDLRACVWDWTGTFPRGREPLVLPRGPLGSVTHIEYWHPEGYPQTLPSTDYYALHGTGVLGRVCPVYRWPATDDRLDAVLIRFATGDTTCPNLARQAICLAVGTWYEHREGETEAQIRTLGLGFSRLVDQLVLQGVA